MNNIEDVITSSIEDATLPIEGPIETDTLPDSTPEPETTDTLETSSTEETPSPEVASPGTKSQEAKPVVDDFEKKYGIPATSSAGRENRIPYSRVKKITERAIADGKSVWTKELETTHVPVAKFHELEATNKDYTERLTKVAEFENVMLNDAPKFLEMLSSIPAYGQIFQKLISDAKGGQTQQTQASEVKQPSPDEAMPEPDQELTDGSKVYSLEGLKALNAWNRSQAKKEVLDEVSKRFGPIETDYQRHLQTQAILPQVNAQIADARTWPLFTENEADIVKILQQYPKASLERAYQHVVWPKLQAEQDKLKKEVETKTGETKVNREALRAEILAELKKAPKSTSVAQGSSSKPVQAASSTPKTLEEIITEAAQTLKK